jgi:hypothetical protein
LVPEEAFKFAGQFRGLVCQPGGRLEILALKNGEEDEFVSGSWVFDQDEIDLWGGGIG